MAKSKPSVGDIFKRTTPKEDAAEDFVKARGVALKESEWAEITKRATELSMNTHKLAAILLRQGLEDLRRGKLKTKRQTTLDLG